MFDIGPGGAAHAAFSQFEEQIFLRAGRVSRGPALRRRSQLFLASCFNYCAKVKTGRSENAYPPGSGALRAGSGNLPINQRPPGREP